MKDPTGAITREDYNTVRWINTLHYKCPNCGSAHLAKDGIVKHKQRYRCLNPKCGYRTIRPRITKPKETIKTQKRRVAKNSKNRRKS